MRVKNPKCSVILEVRINDRFYTSSDPFGKITQEECGRGDVSYRMRDNFIYYIMRERKVSSPKKLRDIANLMGVSVGIIASSMLRLCNKGLLLKVEPGIYRIPPYSNWEMYRDHSCFDKDGELSSLYPPEDLQYDCARDVTALWVYYYERFRRDCFLKDTIEEIKEASYPEYVLEGLRKVYKLAIPTQKGKR